jgi:hypothetical protein
MLEITFSISTHDDGQRRAAVLVQGQPVIAETTDQAGAERTARDLYDRERRRAGRHVRLTAWNGDTATETIIADTTRPDAPFADFAAALNPAGGALAVDVLFTLTAPVARTRATQASLLDKGRR